MADNTIQIGITVDISAVKSNLSQVQSAFQTTTSSVASQWSATSSTIAISLQKVSTEATEAAGRTKEQMEKAASSVGMLGDLIGVKVPGEITKMLAASELIGPALEAAFAPLMIIAAVRFVLELAEKIRELLHREEELREQHIKLNGTFQDVSLSIQGEIDKQKAKFIEITQGPIAAMEYAIKHMSSTAIKALRELDGELETLAADFQERGGFFHPEERAAADEVRKFKADLDKAIRDAVRDHPEDPTAGFKEGIDKTKEKLNELNNEVLKLRGYKGTAWQEVLDIPVEKLHRFLALYSQLNKAFAAATQGVSVQHAEVEEAKLKKSIELKIAQLDANKRVSDAIVQQDEQEIRSILLHRQVGAEEELRLQKGLANKQFQQDEAYLQTKLNQLKRDQKGNAQQIIAANAEIEALRTKRNTTLLKLDDNYYKERKRRAEEQAKAELDAAAALAAIHEHEAKEAAHTLQVWEEQTKKAETIAQLTRDIQDTQAKHNAQLVVALGYMTEEQADQGALKQIEKDKKEALDAINARLNDQIGIVKRLGAETMNGMLGSPQQKAAFQKAVSDYQNFKLTQLGLEKKYDDQIAALQLKLANTFSAQLRKQMLAWKDVHKEMGQVFLSTLNSLNSSLAGFIVTGQANWKQLASTAIEEIIKIGLQWIESQTIMKVLDSFFSKQKMAGVAAENSAKIASASFVASANAYAANSEFPPVAAAAATAASAAVMAMASGAVTAATAGAAKYELGDIVPQTGLALVHKGETILPESMSGKGFDGAIGRGNNFHVHFNVQAMDSEGVDRVLSKHRKLFSDHFFKEAKKKGWK